MRLIARLARYATLGFALPSGACAGGAAAPHTGPGPTWVYEVTAGSGVNDLSVVATFPPKTDTKMTVAEHAEVFLVGVEVTDGPDWHEARRLGSTWDLPACSKGCRIRYRYLLADAAASFDDVALARRDTAAIESPPSTWLLRPEHAPPGTHLRFHVTTAPGEAFVTGVFAAPDAAPGTYEARGEDDPQLPYSAFGRLHLHELQGGTATLALLPGPLPEADVVAWAHASLLAVRGFYGRPPVPHVLILVRPTNGVDVGFGSTMGYSGASIVVNVGEQTTKEAFHADWVLVHELVHTALPDVPAEQHWLEEGLATYVEPLARYRQGGLSEADVWGEWARKMEKGEPEAGDKGLDHTHTWARTYWGGALFCLAADVEIRTRTKGKASLEVALRAVLAAGGNIAVSWPIARVLDVGDQATGTTVLHEMYERLATKPTPVNLAALWRRLGVSISGDDRVIFDDTAELAWVRHAMTPPR
jgi:hypothetical protein